MRTLDIRTNDSAERAGFLKDRSTAHASIKSRAYLITRKRQHRVAPEFVDFADRSDADHGLVINFDMVSALIVLGDVDNRFSVSERRDALSNGRPKRVDSRLSPRNWLFRVRTTRVRTKLQYG